MGVYTTLTAKIKSKLSLVSKIAVVYDNPELDFEKFPAATIIPAEGASDYETNREDERTYVFDASIYYETKTQGISFAIEALFDCVDDVLDTFASDKQLTGVSMPVNKQLLIVEPVFAGWGEVPDKDLIVARVTLKCRVSCLN